MGVDFITCEHCGHNFPDCGEYGQCSCERDFCIECYGEFKEKYGLTKDQKVIDWQGESALDKCPYCSGDIIEDDEIVEYLLSKYNLNREDVENEIRQRKSNINTY